MTMRTTNSKLQIIFILFEFLLDETKLLNFVCFTIFYPETSLKNFE
jgi:hypothetical protein